MPFDIDSIEDENLKAEMQEFLQAQLDGQKETLTEEISGQFQKDIEALKNNGTKLLGEKSEEVERRKALEAVFGKRKPEEVAEMLQSFESDEDAALLKAGKLDEYKQRITERERAASESLVAQESEKRTLAEQQAETYKKQIHDLTVGTAIRAAFVASGGVPEEKAQEYAAIEASRWWAINADGQKECRDPVTGDLVKGKTGLITEAEWIQEKFRPTAPFMFEDAKGSGAAGGDKASGGKPFKELSLEEQSARVDEVGLEAAMAG